MSEPWDAIVVGGGHNALVCAAYLARAGRRVLVLERRAALGGAAVTEEPWPGFRVPTCAHVVGLLRPWVARDLDLARHGLRLVPLTASYTPHPDGPGLCLWEDADRTRAEIARFSTRDADVWGDWIGALARVARVAREVFDAPAPDLASPRPADVTQLAGLRRAFAALDDDARDLAWALVTGSAEDLLERTFRHDAIRAPLAARGGFGGALGPHEPGSAIGLLLDAIGALDAPRAVALGGPGAIAEALASAARGFGAELRVGAEVAAIRVAQGRAVGVTLANGEELPARVVISGAEPGRTLLGLVGAEHLPWDLAEKLRARPPAGSVAKVNLALDGPIEARGRSGLGPHLRGEILIAPSSAWLGEAWSASREGRHSPRPVCEVVIPTLTDPGLAPPGKHVVSVLAQHAPYHRDGGAASWPAHRDALLADVLDTLTAHFPGLRDRVVHAQVLTPWDLEQGWALTGGDPFHGAMVPERLASSRPLPGLARYRTPLRGLWTCGSGAHPGGRVSGAPGALAAKLLLDQGAL